MTLIAGDILADAEALAYPFISERSTAGGPLLRQLSTLDAEVTGMFASMAPQLVAQEASAAITITPANNAGGYELEAGRAYTRFRLVTDEGYFQPIRIVPQSHFDNAPLHPAAMVGTGDDAQQNPVRFFYPCDSLKKRWADATDAGRQFFVTGQSVTYMVVPEPVALTSRTSVLVSPDYAAPFLQWSLAAGILFNAHGDGMAVPQERLQMAVQAPTALRQSLWQTIAKLAPIESSMRGI